MGTDALLDLAVRTLPPASRLLHLGSEPAPPARLAAHRVTVVPLHEAMRFLEAHAGEPFDAAVAAFPTRDAPLIPLLRALHRALRPDGVAILCDLVWGTAPTPDLLRAFVPPPGHDKVRPVEGYEMQIEHAEFSVVTREILPRELAARTPDQQSALKSDDRGAARVVGWVLRRDDG